MKSLRIENPACTEACYVSSTWLNYRIATERNAVDLARGGSVAAGAAPAP